MNGSCVNVHILKRDSLMVGKKRWPVSSIIPPVGDGVLAWKAIPEALPDHRPAVLLLLAN